MLTFSAGFDQNTQVGLSLVQSLGALSETSSKTIVDQGVLEGKSVQMPNLDATFELTFKTS